MFFFWFQNSWSHSYVVPNWVVFGEIVRRGFIFFPKEYVEILMSYYIAHPIKSHVYCSGYILLAVTFAMIFVTVLSVASTLVVIDGPFLLERSVLMFPFGSY